MPRWMPCSRTSRSRSSPPATNKTLHPLLIVAVFVVVFLEIHPFEDGNGRLSRILTTLLMLQFGYGYVPYSSLESIIEQNKGVLHRPAPDTGNDPHGDPERATVAGVFPLVAELAGQAPG